MPLYGDKKINQKISIPFVCDGKIPLPRSAGIYFLGEIIIIIIIQPWKILGCKYINIHVHVKDNTFTHSSTHWYLPAKKTLLYLDIS